MAYAILTRDPESAAPYAAALAARGLSCEAMPVTTTAAPHDRDALLRALELGGYSAIVVASARAAMALLAARGHAPLPEVWAVGPATARVLEAAHVPPLVPANARDGAALAHALLAARELTGKKVLVPRAEDGREELVDILRAGGAIVDAVAAYRTVATAPDDPSIARGREILAAGDAAICAVFAPSQVSALDALVGIRRLAGVWFVAIGETTAQALRDAGAEHIAVAAAPTPEALANAVAAVYPRAT
ncbi:MAG TPA: uroporphyrinogen-III synthase [Kofleriaceae bacterium]|nr:uroporphyrinogen-III synthase [Kofleriaceae bacterium]